jgi:hypothetical protein
MVETPSFGEFGYPRPRLDWQAPDRLRPAGLAACAHRL